MTTSSYTVRVLYMVSSQVGFSDQGGTFEQALISAKLRDIWRLTYCTYKGRYTRLKWASDGIDGKVKSFCQFKPQSTLLQLFRKLSDSFFTDHGRRLRKCSRRPRRNTSNTADELAICGQLQTLFETLSEVCKLPLCHLLEEKTTQELLPCYPLTIFAICARETVSQYLQKMQKQLILQSSICRKIL